MLRIDVKIGKVWKRGIQTYNTHAEAKKRQNELCKLGMKTRIVMY